MLLYKCSLIQKCWVVSCCIWHTLVDSFRTHYAISALLWLMCWWARSCFKMFKKIGIKLRSYCVVATQNLSSSISRSTLLLFNWLTLRVIAKDIGSLLKNPLSHCWVILVKSHFWDFILLLLHSGWRIPWAWVIVAACIRTMTNIILLLFYK